ncbi:DUF1330 domain-containing protein [Gordonia sp. Z-3]|uniref:DUF1330 domain-containing protein n=1 Tax=Gordonia tangerina TaxID=2911060 RepID=A0ABS9DDF0_9ACTN|nr:MULTISPECIES: DUF1330 domain-containing protein [Gordonia]MCF3937250.1 DUF1330 domain-containing protein [Gordonia tangerina]MED5803665.1 DUF1330 domain-containing protein [Gordonia sp. Z-3]
MPVTLVVLLWSVDGCDDALHAYEDDVLRLVSAHGGRVLVRARRTDDDPSHPLETQVIEFDDRAGSDAYLADPRRMSMADRRAACVARTQMWPVTV